MKKKLLAVLVAMLVLTMSTTSVFAALSPTAETATILADAVDSQDGDVEVLEQDVLAEALSFIDDLVEMFTADLGTVDTPQGAPVPAGSPIATIISQYTESNDVAADEVVVVPEVKAAFDFIPSDEVAAAIEETGSATVAFNCDVKAGASVVVLHFNGDEWEVIVPDSVDNGVVTATFTSFSPIAIVELTTDVAETSADEDVSPKTGVGVAVFGVSSLVCLAGAAVCGKKSKNQ